MKIVYGSRTGNVETFVGKLGLSNTMLIKNGSETVDEEFVLITYTDGDGELPYEVEEFLGNNANFIRGVAGSGDKDYGDNFCMAATIVSDQYGVPVLATFENDGERTDVENFLAALKNL
jgi:protein involved in ribonucleotide reduction